MVRLLSVSLALIISISSNGQKEKIFGQDVERIFRMKEDSTQNFYLVLEPATPPKGLLVILAGFGGFPREVLEETDLPAKARKQGYVVVIPYLAVRTFYTEELSQQRLTTLIPEVIKKYKIPRNKFVIGGHSAGGNGALLYAEAAFKLNQDDVVKPAAVFGVDPPLDMKRLYNSMAYADKINFHKAATDEARYFLSWFKQELGGTPEEKPDQYEKISSFYRDAEGGKIKYLTTVPVRLYCDPDIQWYLENRRAPYEHLNASDLSAAIAQLKLMGNDKAELVTNIGKGYFPGGRRHPHGFTSLDADEFLRWMEKILDSK